MASSQVISNTNTALIKQNAVIDLYFVCLATPFYAANNIFTSVYEVRELVKHAHLNYALETCVLFILYSVVLSPLMGVTGLWALSGCGSDNPDCKYNIDDTL